MSAIHSAVMAEAPNATTVVNALADVNDSFAEMLGLRRWNDSLSDWAQFASVLGIDAYPNRLSARPFLLDVLQDHVARAKAVPAAAATGGGGGVGEQRIEGNTSLPVWVTEVGYSAWQQAPPGLFPAINFTAQDQAEFMSSLFPLLDSSGADGVFIFGAW